MHRGFILGFYNRGRGGGFRPHPHPVSVQRFLSALREFLHEQAGDSSPHRLGELRGHGVSHSLAQFESLGSDIVAEVLSHGVVEVEGVPRSILTEGGLVPDFPHLVAHPLRHRLADYESVQHLVSFLLRQILAIQIIEEFSRVSERFDARIEC